jgi:tetratricopeptide (TPR) repeat protein
LKLEKVAIAATLLNLGFVCERQGKYAQAEQFYGRALTIFRDTVEPNDPSLALALYHYDNIIKKTNNIATKSFKGSSALNNAKYTHQNTARSTQKSKKMKRKKQR